MTVTDLLVQVDTPKLSVSTMREVQCHFLELCNLTSLVQVPETLRPTWEGRGWLIHPLGNNPVWSAFAAIIPALLGTILIFMDQQITAVIVNRKEHKLVVSLYRYHAIHKTCLSHTRQIKT